MFEKVQFSRSKLSDFWGFNPKKGSFSRYFIKCFTFNLNKANQEKYFYNVYK